MEKQLVLVAYLSRLWTIVMNTVIQGNTVTVTMPRSTFTTESSWNIFAKAVTMVSANHHMTYLGVKTLSSTTQTDSSTTQVRTREKQRPKPFCTQSVGRC